ncbi:ankyrin repeat-containing domain protein [Aspergillus spinulosporus]
MPLITLNPDEVDDLIYDVRAGDSAALEEDLTALSQKYSVKPAVIIASAVDLAPEDEGGSGCCLLHYPAANGNLEILTNLKELLLSAPNENILTAAEVKNTVNHRNHSGNTPLHWAALNTHLECVKVLVEAGADISIKNEAGLDAVFLAERADWKAQEATQTPDPSQGQDQDGDEEMEVEVADDAAEGGNATQVPVTKARQIVDWLLEHGEPAEAVGAGSAPGNEP